MKKAWGIKIVCLVFITLVQFIRSDKHANHNDPYRSTIGVEDLNNIDRKRSKNDFYVFSDNTLQLSSQFPVVSLFESLSLIWISIYDQIKLRHKNEGALIILFLISPLYRAINDDKFEGDELFNEMEQFDDHLSQVIYCLIQTSSGINCELAIDEFITFLNDQVLYEIQKHKNSDYDVNMTSRVSQITNILNTIKNMQLYNVDNQSNMKMYNTLNPETFLLHIFNINNLFEYYMDFNTGISYMAVLGPLRTLLDSINKNWNIGENKDHNSWFRNKTSPLKNICDEMIAGVNKIREEINHYYESKSYEKLIILTETKLYTDSLLQFCIDHNEFINQSDTNTNKDNVIPENLTAISSIIVNGKNLILGMQVSKLYEYSRKATDTDSQLCMVSSDKKVLSSEGLSEYELDQDISTTLLDLIGSFFVDNKLDTKLYAQFMNTCPTTKNLIFNSKMLSNERNFAVIGNLIKDLGSILSVKRTSLASKMCSKLTSMLDSANYTNKRLISIHRLLIPLIVSSSLVSILPGNSEIYKDGDFLENNLNSGKIFIDTDRSCLINHFDTINYYIRETNNICEKVKDYSTIFGSAFNKIANQKAITQMNQSLQKISQSQLLHEFRELGRDLKGSKYGHFVSEVGNNCFSSLRHWYHFSQKRRRLKGARRLLRKAFYTYTSSLDNVNVDLRPELINIQTTAAKLETNELKILTNGEFVFLNSKAISSYMKKRYTKHTAKMMTEHYKLPGQMLKEDFPITIENLKELNSLIKMDLEKHKDELEKELSIMKETGDKFRDNEELPFFKSGKTNFVLIGRDFSSFALCQCKIRGSRQFEMLKLFSDLLFQIQHVDIRITGYDMLSHSLKKAIRQMLIIISLNEFAINLLPKVRKGGYQRFYRMRHSTHKALRKRVKKYLLDIKQDAYKLSVVVNSLHSLLLTAFNHFKYDPELDILRKSFSGIDTEKSDWGTYSHKNSLLKASDAIRRRTIEKLVGDFYFGRIRRSFSSLKETILQMMNPQQILSLSQIFKTDLGVKDIDGIVGRLHQYLKSIYPSQNCIGVDQGQKLEPFFALC
ncbi:putative signal peptide-containing secreted protein [Cryptosporidium canis]|uniref:Signal peptide-containing secreted protein n=1 Tax=Cryptosporidium canis TaxID=195482 RepID=A0A9D5HZC5_9CRYT|nr:putative signal peptide-containing secreted protein [Cryptosporidium canis]